VTHGDFLVYSYLTDNNAEKSPGNVTTAKKGMKKKRPISVKIPRDRIKVDLQVKFKLSREALH
jgi:hypothetical protein